ncbi:MAG: leucyl aminopeptidase [Acidobacteriota bacterium]
MNSMPRLSVSERQEVASELLVVGCFEGAAAEAEGLPAPLVEAIEGLANRAGWSGREEHSGETEARLDGASVVVRLQGLGKAKELTATALTDWLRDQVEEAGGQGYESLAVLLPHHDLTVGAAAAGRNQRALLLGGYRYDRFRTEAKRTRDRVLEVSLLPPPAAEATYRACLVDSRQVGEGIAFARDLGNAPASLASPEWMADQARTMAEGEGISCTVLGPDELKEKGMGGILAVGGGSAHEPRLVKLEWGDRGPTVAIVGKGVTFDTGGISLKPAHAMDEMKYDKCGACAALGIAQAVARLDLPLRLRVYVPLAENMPGGAAYRPGDIVRCYNGKTVEILNTDAEGRMILADALAWAVEEKPDALLELSTLTGACVVALGFQAAGLYAPNRAFADELLAASERSGERLWHMPLWRDHVEQIKGVHGDLKNLGGRWGGANTAAAFLSQFVGDLEHWAHLDIAGVANIGPDQEAPQGATGFGVALGIDWLRSRLS